jgi:hypothetical protein
LGARKHEASDDLADLYRDYGGAPPNKRKRKSK